MKLCQEDVSISSSIENQIDLSLPHAINLRKYLLMTTSLVTPFIHLSSHTKTQASTVDGKAYISSELHKQGDLPKFLILELVFLLGHINCKETRIKLSFAFFSAEEEWYSNQQSQIEAQFSKEIGFILPVVFKVPKPS